ncbi:hypothetical protein ACFCYH_31905 [Streptomyces sp. NPDC056400]|uniref:hypothetical protein n=1 Tax=Streptomyces sp. NPDC056400 TaxID=3345808 RepID=UPI0035DA27A1
MRNEYASVPWLAPIADLMPKVLARGSHPHGDWQGLDDPVLPARCPARQKLDSFPKDTHGLFFRQEVGEPRLLTGTCER